MAKSIFLQKQKQNLCFCIDNNILKNCLSMILFSRQIMLEIFIKIKYTVYGIIIQICLLKGITKMKKQALKIIAISLIATVLLNILAACNNKSGTDATLDNYNKLIAQLNTEIDELESRNESLYGDYEKKIAALRGEVEKLTEKITQDTGADTTVNPPVAVLPFEYTIENNQVTITKYTGEYETVVIPSSIENTPVTKIGEIAFEDTEVISVTIPSGVTLVDWFAFRGCYRLTDIYIPDSVTKINYGVFDGASKVKIHCCSDSYAEKYAKSFAIQYLLKD